MTNNELLEAGRTIKQLLADWKQTSILPALSDMTHMTNAFFEDN